jgi:hypothetical protein
MVAHHSVQIAYANFEVLRSISRHEYNQQWNVTLQRELPAEVVVSAAYVGSKGTRLWLNREVNPAVPSRVSKRGLDHYAFRPEDLPLLIPPAALLHFRVC